MIWLTGITCLAVGLAAGLLLARIIKGDNPARVNELENRLQDLQRDQAVYRDQVSEHFNTTAELVHQMTESYRDVYQHLASGAQNLCTEDVASKLLPAGEQKMFASDEDSSNVDATNTKAKGSDSIEQPKDYAPKKSSGPGALSEEFGLEKEKHEDQNQDDSANEKQNSSESESDNNSDADSDKESDSNSDASTTDKKQ
ncbi:cytochrome d ubiquinol oxidase subunit III (cytochrome bd-I oxidase subunit III) [Pseudohongiella nitratireducens]|jgi:hypothetical protein|uniref:Z-ring associated protein G n=1 Tax=Pseudohongiella nitratireducens TaxID=1768907 RepID=A0A916QM36_9GAMM|nr:DUF1043 family protein [Pseudohongiella nitratireducens]MDF1624473.1 DUF1043 family protein [Pseudohongiella nitratireducens]GFZ78690.1 cytochrome d ubiquinol oxidase subunit III (cytochrome bd-I oxidase subunit III) [Pseudohongiella nitratireducens]|tara:strand:- start:195 stop:791 length:597 start_codon:yes stop_codon:yes gene_type:complete